MSEILRRPGARHPPEIAAPHTLSHPYSIHFNGLAGSRAGPCFRRHKSGTLCGTPSGTHKSIYINRLYIVSRCPGCPGLSLVTRARAGAGAHITGSNRAGQPGQRDTCEYPRAISDLSVPHTVPDPVPQAPNRAIFSFLFLTAWVRVRVQKVRVFRALGVGEESGAACRRWSVPRPLVRALARPRGSRPRSATACRRRSASDGISPVRDLSGGGLTGILDIPK
jgi:hypothetical protein